jgi:hypothetical protein
MTSGSLFRHALQQQEVKLRGCHVDLPTSGREELGGDGNGDGEVNVLLHVREHILEGCRKLLFQSFQNLSLYHERKVMFFKKVL